MAYGRNSHISPTAPERQRAANADTNGLKPNPHTLIIDDAAYSTTRLVWPRVAATERMAGRAAEKEAAVPVTIFFRTEPRPSGIEHQLF